VRRPAGHPQLIAAGATATPGTRVRSLRPAPRGLSGHGEGAGSVPLHERPRELATSALMLVPGAMVVFLGFNAGGYFPNTVAVSAIVLAQVLLVRLVRSREPLAGIAPATVAAIAALVSYAALTLASALWSHALGRALIEFDRACLYLLALVLFGSVRATASQLRWLVRGLVVGIAAVCVAGLASRVAPDVWHTAPDVSNERLSYPVTYWNALGVLAALGIVLGLHLACSLHERRATRTLAAGVLPLLAATLFFTFSRGAIAAGVVGLAVYATFARPRALAGGLLAVVAPTVALLDVAYHANLLDTVDPTTPAAVAQGHRVALAAGICALLAAALRWALAVRLDGRRHGSGAAASRVPAGARRAILAGGLAALVAAAVALGAWHTVSNDWNRFFSGATPHGNHGDLRRRLTDPANNGRSDLWTAALHGFAASPLRGSGAGTYQTIWDQRRPRFSYAVNAHSLYLQAMAELGLPGVLLLALLVGVVLRGLAVRARASERSLYGALLAVGVVWALHAGIDWDWEMPVVTLPLFAVAGLALGPRAHRGLDGARAGGVFARTRDGLAGAHRARVAARAALVCAALAALVLPVLVIGSQSRLAGAERALYGSRCDTAQKDARGSIGWLGMRPQPYEVIGFCDLRAGDAAAAVTAMRQALARDPHSWEPRYALAIAQAAAGIDPRAAAARARAMNPFEPLTRQAFVVLAARGGPRVWRSRARQLRAAALASNDLSIVPS
jgi:O-antigen ligase